MIEGGYSKGNGYCCTLTNIFTGYGHCLEVEGQHIETLLRNKVT